MDHPHGEIQDPEFLRFLEEIGRERMAAFSTDDFLVIVSSMGEKPCPTISNRGLSTFSIKVSSNGWAAGGVFACFSPAASTATSVRRESTRASAGSTERRTKRYSSSISRTTRPAAHVWRSCDRCCRRSLAARFRSLMRELVREGSVHVHGATKAARWYPGPQRADCNHKEAWLQ